MNFLLLIVFATTAWSSSYKDPFDELILRLPAPPVFSTPIISKEDHEAALEAYKDVIVYNFREFYDGFAKSCKNTMNGLDREISRLKYDVEENEIARKKISDLEKENLTLKIENSAKEQKIRSLEAPSIWGRFGRFG